MKIDEAEKGKATQTKKKDSPDAANADAFFSLSRGMGPPLFCFGSENG